MYRSSRYLSGFLLCGLVVAGFSATAFPETLFSKNADTQVYKEPSAHATVIDKLDAGARVRVSKTEGKFHQVTTPSGKTGFVFKFNLGIETPKRKDELSKIPVNKMKVIVMPPTANIRGEESKPDQHKK